MDLLTEEQILEFEAMMARIDPVIGFFENHVCNVRDYYFGVDAYEKLSKICSIPLSDFMSYISEVGEDSDPGCMKIIGYGEKIGYAVYVLQNNELYYPIAIQTFY